MFTTFRGGQSGGWQVTSITRVKGETLPKVAALSIVTSESIALPLLRAASARAGEPVALLHFDAHLDTWDTYFGAEYTHGTPFRRAVEEGILDTEAISHVGTRGPLYGKKDLDDDQWAALRAVTSEREAIELLLLVGHYDMLATTLLTLRVEPDRKR